MAKKTLKLTQITTISLTAILILSSFVGAARFAGGAAANISTQTTGSASVIASLENSIAENGGWNSSLQTIYDGIALGETTVGQLQNAVDSVNISSTAAAETVFYWYFELSKFGVGINATTIEAALNETTMLPTIGGLPFDYSNPYTDTDSFLVYNRYDLYAYQWANQLDYETSKWNISEAYAVFNDSVTAYGKPLLSVGDDGKGWGISYGPRYYDECAETIDMYLTFWLLGEQDGLTQAVYWWNWVNSNLWDTVDWSSGSFYKYALNWTAFECEAGGMDQIIWKLYNYDPSILNVYNLVTDMETRALSQGWSSPQWADYVVVHALGVDGSGGNTQQRLENTIMSWGALLGFYCDMTSTMQSQVQELLDGSAGPAWSLILQSQVYDNSNSMFRIYSGASDSSEATADGAVLLMLLSTVPMNGSLAVPLADSIYEDINNVIDGGISNINLTSRTVTVSVGTPGTFRSMFGTDVFDYNLSSSGVWQLTFTADWNNITSETLLSALPTSRLYLGIVNNSRTISASSDSYSSIYPSGFVNVNYGDNQTFNYSADDGYVITQVLVDGSPVPITGSYTFTDAQPLDTISVSSSPVPTQTPSPTSPSPTPTPTPSPSPTPTTSPTSSQAPTASTNPSPSSSLTPSPASSPTPSPTSSTRGFSLNSIRLPLLNIVAIALAAVLVILLLLSIYIKKSKTRFGRAAG